MLEIARAEIEKFAAALFRHAGTEGFVSLRAFYEDDSTKPFRITPTGMAGGLPSLVEAAEDDAHRAANHPRKIVFCPPIAIFRGRKTARESDIVAGFALSVECDQRPTEAAARLEQILGPATLIVRSGGTWTDPASNQIYDKLHLHWRLRVPASGKELAKLKQARDLAAGLVGGDPSNKPVCHPIRWPGSWHRKAEPRLCEIETETDHEIDLGEALAALQKATPCGVAHNSKPNSHNVFEAFGQSVGQGGSNWAELVAGIVNGIDYHNATVRLAAKMVASGMDDGAAVNMLRGMFETSSAPRDARWETRFADIPRAVSTAREKCGTPSADPRDLTSPGAAPLLAWVDMSNWDNEERPEREWAIRDRVPLNQAGLFSGEGGTGKSIIEMMKDVAHVMGKDWLGSMPEPGPAFYIGAEDDEKEIHIRFHDIAAHYGVTFKELIEGGLHVLCRLGQDATLCAVAGKSGRVEVTQFYRQLLKAAGDVKPKNISIDTLSRAFAGNEIDRVQVYAFAMHMQALAMAASGSVTILSHPSLSGIASGSGISGSTAWHGAFRFRQYLTGVKADGGEQPENDLRQIEFKKNQYGPAAESIVLRYQRGLFLPVAAMGSLAKLAADQQAEELFLELLDKFTKQGRNVSHNKTAHSYAPTAFANDPKAKVPGTRKALAAAMERLFAAKKIRVDDYGPPSHPHTRLARCA